jgi:hypothetical protein
MATVSMSPITVILFSFTSAVIESMPDEPTNKTNGALRQL